MSDVSKDDALLYHEEQRFRQVYLWLALLAGFAIIGVAATVLWSGEKGLVILILIPFAMLVGISILMRMGRLTTEVRESGLYVEFSPLESRQKISLESVTSCKAVRYSSWKYGCGPGKGGFGGGGYCGHGGGKAFVVRGNRGLQLDYVDGKHLLIGSQRADELVRAVESIRSSPATAASQTEPLLTAT